MLIKRNWLGEWIDSVIRILIIRLVLVWRIIGDSPNLPIATWAFRVQVLSM